jgi:hypothetical protein
VDVGDNSSSGNSSLDESIKLLISADGELQMPGRNTLDLQVLARVSGELKNLSGQVLEDGGGVDRGGRSNALLRLDGTLQEPVDPTDGELKSGAAGPRLRGLLRGGGFASLSSLLLVGKGWVGGWWGRGGWVSGLMVCIRYSSSSSSSSHQTLPPETKQFLLAQCGLAIRLTFPPFPPLPDCG